MRPCGPDADPETNALRPRPFPGLGDRMEPSHQIRIFMLMALVSLLFVAQLTAQTGAFAALP